MEYVFDNTQELAEIRYRDLSELYDAQTIRHIEQRSIQEGWSCLEVGPGGGSIASWLCSLAGDSAQALRLANDLSQRFSKDTMVQSEYLPMIHAVIILGSRGSASKDAAKAIEAPAVAAPYEMGNPVQTVDFNLYPVYRRGQAYLASRQGAEAVAEFQKILDHPGVVLNEPVGALAYLGLGRGYAIQGDIAKARAQYQFFLKLWKDADSDIPILKEAKSEYAKLQ